MKTISVDSVVSPLAVMLSDAFCKVDAPIRRERRIGSHGVMRDRESSSQEKKKEKER